MNAPLPDPTQRWGIQALWQQVAPLLPDLSIEVVERLGSTNAELAERLRSAASSARGRDARADDLHPSLLVAVQQTRGRGRMGRNWQSVPELSLTFSLSLPVARADWSGLSLAVGLALAEALDPEGRHIGLKWPNDLWLRDGSERKLGGILIEALQVGDRRVAIIGVGLNVQPMPLAESSAALSEFVSPLPTAPWTLAQVMPGLVRMLARFEREGFAGLVPAFAARDVLAGSAVSTTDPNCPSGLAEGVAEDGALRVRAPSGLCRIVSGEVSVRPTRHPAP